MRRGPVVILSIIAMVLVAVLAACSSSPATGSLKVTVSGLPGGVNGNVAVTGPGGYASTVTVTTTLSGLTPGAYTVTGNSARATGPVVAAAYAPTGGGSLTVSANATASSSVTYNLITGSGKLWVADQAAGTKGFSASQLTSSGSPTPDVVLTGSGSGNGLALDANGNLWVGTAGQTLVEFTASQLASSGTPTPSVTIGSDGTSLSWPGSLAFDSKGDLWVGNCGGSGNTVEMYTPSQLAATGSPSPSVSISGTFGSCATVALDAQGNLWIGAQGDNNVIEFTPSQVAASGSPIPHITLTSTAFSSPEGLAFDANGNLWVANEGSSGADALLMFTSTQISAGGAQTPSVSIGDDGSGNLGNPVYVALDNSGNLWVSNYGKNNVLEFAAADITSTGTPSATVVLTGFSSFNFPQFSFDPPPSNLPLAH